MTRATFKKGAKLERWERNLANPRKALAQIGVLMVAESQLAFREQQHGRDKWDARAVPNVYGIIEDFHAGRKSPPARRFERRPALRDTGRLVGSIAYKVFGRSTVEVGSNLEYAGVLQEGGPIKSKPIKPIRELLWKWLKKQNKSRKAELGWLFARKFDDGLEGEVAARPFVGITKKTIEDVREVTGLEIMEVR